MRKLTCYIGRTMGMKNGIGRWALGVLMVTGACVQTAQATPNLRALLTSLGVQNVAAFTPEAFSPLYGEISEYQVGDVWGKHPVFESSLGERSKAYQRAALATGYIVVGGTGFYLGKFSGEHVIATNHHVCPTAKDCEGQKMEFRLLHRVYKIKKLLQSLENVDLSLLTIDVPASDEDGLKSVGRMFSFHQHTYRGEPLITIGFGIAGNPHNYMMGTDDSDCKVFSGTGEYRHLGDPDKFNPEPYKAWSFAHGCDMSHGDSGSAMIDRRNGAIVGIIWTGRIPKLKRTQDSAKLNVLIKQPNEQIWTDLNYAVAATKIGEYLYEQTLNTSLPVKTKSIYMQMLDAGRGLGNAAE